MIFVVDTNVVFSGLLKNAKTRELLVSTPFELIAPESMLNEIRKHRELILKKSGLNAEEFEILFDLITENIRIYEKKKYSHKLKEAEKLLDSDEKGDCPFLALALIIPNNGIWTADKHFKKQNKVRVWTTKEIIEESNK